MRANGGPKIKLRGALSKKKKKRDKAQRHITRPKNTVVINVFIAKKLDFQNCCFNFLTLKLCMRKFI